MCSAEYGAAREIGQLDLGAEVGVATGSFAGGLTHDALNAGELTLGGAKLGPILGPIFGGVVGSASADLATERPLGGTTVWQGGVAGVAGDVGKSFIGGGSASSASEAIGAGFGLLFGA